VTKTLHTAAARIAAQVWGGRWTAEKQQSEPVEGREVSAHAGEEPPDGKP